MYRQGDIGIILVDDIDTSTLKEIQKDAGGRIVLAYGEATGHAHAIIEPSAQLFETEVDLFDGCEMRLLRCGVDSPLVHEEHGCINIPAGTYYVIQQREYRPERNISVLD